MQKNILNMLCLTVLLPLVALANNGATTIGDGGHVVVCPLEREQPQVMLLDLFEGSASGYGTEIDFDGAVSLTDKVKLGLERVNSQLKLNPLELSKMKKWSNKINWHSYDPWKNGYTFKAKDPSVSLAVYEELIVRNCYVDTVVIHPDTKSRYGDRKTYENLCMANGKVVQDCFLVNTRYVRNMSSDEKACLILHEILRLLVSTGKIMNEQSLRRSTFYACTGI